MIASQSFTRRSPHQIRQLAATAFRNRVRAGLSRSHRLPDPDETPLSAAEVTHGVRAGLIQPMPARDAR